MKYYIKYVMGLAVAVVMSAVLVAVTSGALALAILGQTRIVDKVMKKVMNKFG